MFMISIASTQSNLGAPGLVLPEPEHLLILTLWNPLGMKCVKMETTSLALEMHTVRNVQSKAIYFPFPQTQHLTGFEILLLKLLFQCLYICI